MISILPLALAFGAQATPVPPAVDPPTTQRGGLYTVSIPWSGCKLQSVPMESRSAPFILSVSEEGASGRVEVRAFCIMTGTYNLGDFLECADGTKAVGIPAIPLRVVTALPPGVHVDLEESAVELEPIRPSPAWVGPAVICAWVVLPLAWVAVRGGRRGRAPTASPTELPPQRDPLEALLRAMDERPLTMEERGSLELLALRRMMARTGVAPHIDSPYEAYRLLRINPVTTDAVGILERWLHHPAPAPGLEGEVRRAISACVGGAGGAGDGPRGSEVP